MNYKLPCLMYHRSFMRPPFEQLVKNRRFRNENYAGVRWPNCIQINTVVDDTDIDNLSYENSNLIKFLTYFRNLFELINFKINNFDYDWLKNNSSLSLHSPVQILLLPRINGGNVVLFQMGERDFGVSWASRNRARWRQTITTNGKIEGRKMHANW